MPTLPNRRGHNKDHAVTLEQADRPACVSSFVRLTPRRTSPFRQAYDLGVLLFRDLSDYGAAAPSNEKLVRLLCLDPSQRHAIRLRWQQLCRDCGEQFRAGTAPEGLSLVMQGVSECVERALAAFDRYRLPDEQDPFLRELQGVLVKAGEDLEALFPLAARWPSNQTDALSGLDLAKLSESEQLILQMKKSGLTWKEIGSRYGTSADGAKQLGYRIRKKGKK